MYCFPYLLITKQLHPLLYVEYPKSQPKSLYSRKMGRKMLGYRRLHYFIELSILPSQNVKFNYKPTPITIQISKILKYTPIIKCPREEKSREQVD